MRNKILILLGILILIGAVVAVLMYSKNRSQMVTPSEVVTENSSDPTTYASSSNSITSATGSGQKGAYPTDLWVIFSQYIEKAKKHDLVGLSSYSFYLSGVCKDPKQKDECFNRMDALVDAAQPLSQKDFVNIWQDDKQAVLSTNFVTKNGALDFGFVRSTIIFGKDVDGNYKILALNPEQFWQIKRNAASTTEEVEAKLSAMIKDTDQDGVTDEFENCIFPENLLVFSCIKTDPKKRDSNGDGWWDSVQLYIQKP